MRSESVNITGQTIVIREMKIGELKTNVLPKVEVAWKAIVASDLSLIVDSLGDQIKEIIPELATVNIDDCYSSELEGFMEAWINVNFSGIKRLAGPVLSLILKDKQPSGLG